MPSREALYGLPAISKAKMEKRRDADDVCMHSLHHFGKLLSQGNFIILEMMFAKDVLIVDPLFKSLFIDHREEFLSDLLVLPLLGFAKSQLNKLDNHPHKSPSRVKLYEEHGYDTKYLMHCVRILKVGIEYIETGKFRTDWTDERELFLGIKHGRWPRDIIEAETKVYQEKLKKYIDDNLKPDYQKTYDKINSNVMQLCYEYVTSAK